MAMNLRLSPAQQRALKRAAAQDGISMHEAVLRAVDSYSSGRRAKLLAGLEKIKTEDAELLKRLSR